MKITLMLTTAGTTQRSNSNLTTLDKTLRIRVREERRHNQQAKSSVHCRDSEACGEESKEVRGSLSQQRRYGAESLDLRQGDEVVAVFSRFARKGVKRKAHASPPAFKIKPTYVPTRNMRPQKNFRRPDLQVIAAAQAPSPPFMKDSSAYDGSSWELPLGSSQGSPGRPKIGSSQERGVAPRSLGSSQELPRPPGSSRELPETPPGAPGSSRAKV